MHDQRSSWPSLLYANPRRHVTLRIDILGKQPSPTLVLVLDRSQADTNTVSATIAGITVVVGEVVALQTRACFTAEPNESRASRVVIWHTDTRRITGHTTSPFTRIINALIVRRARVRCDDVPAARLIRRRRLLSDLDGLGWEGIALSEAAIRVDARWVVGHADGAVVARRDPEAAGPGVVQRSGAGAGALAHRIGAVGAVRDAHVAVGARRQLEAAAGGRGTCDQCDEDGK